MVHVLCRPCGYQSALQPAPVRASRQRTHVTVSHRLILPYVALREKVCRAERQTNSVQRRFNSRSGTRCSDAHRLQHPGKNGKKQERPGMTNKTMTWGRSHVR